MYHGSARAGHQSEVRSRVSLEEIHSSREEELHLASIEPVEVKLQSHHGSQLTQNHQHQALVKKVILSLRPARQAHLYSFSNESNSSEGINRQGDRVHVSWPSASHGLMTTLSSYRVTPKQLAANEGLLGSAYMGCIHV